MDNLIQSLERMAEREKTTFDKVVEIVSSSIELVYKRSKLLENENLKVIFDGSKFIVKDGLSSFELKSLESDKKFSYECAEEIKKSLGQLRKIKEYEHFSPLNGEIISGSLQSINEDGKYCIFNLVNGLGYWEKKEWKKESLTRKIHLGSFLRFLISDVKMLEKSTQVIITRNGENFIEKIFQLEIPEIRRGLIKVEKIIRLQGLVSKVVLKSESERNLDPIGVCIGKDRLRIKSILKDLGKERIDLVAWNENKKKLLINLLSPSEVISVIEKSETDWEVVVPSFRVSLILQSSGKVLQSIEDYLDIKINVRSFEDFGEEDIIIWNGNTSFDEFETKKNINLRKNSKV